MLYVCITTCQTEIFINYLIMDGYMRIMIILLLCLLSVNGQTTTVSQSGCSYTFLVSKQEDNSCPVGSVASAPSNEEMDYLKSIIRNQQDQLSVLSQNYLKQQEEIEAIKNNIAGDSANNNGGGSTNNNGDIKIGTNYVRWGRTSCPDTAELIYKGYSAKSFYTHTGGGANYICLDSNPKWPDVTTAGFQGSLIYGVEYQTLPGLDSSLTQNDAPCAVCNVNGRGQHLMIPGNRTCPESWTKEYEGLLVSQQHNHQKATYVCLDGEPEVIAGGGSDKNGGLFYTVEARCDYSLPCPPYVDGYEIACVVCTH